jgi:lipoprotein-releasing system permease protein
VIELAKDLGAEVGDKLRLSAADGRSDTLTITGLFDLGNKGVNARNVYVGLRTAQSLLDLVGGVSSIDQRTTSTWPSNSPAASPAKPG